MNDTENVTLKYANVAEMITSSVNEFPDKTITYVESDSRIIKTYEETYSEAKILLANLQKNGLSAGDNVVLALDKHSDNIPLLWACVLGGIVPCPITIKVSDMELWKKTLNHISQLLDDPTFIISSETSKWNDLAYHLAQIGATYQPSGNVQDVTLFYAQPIWGSKEEYLSTMLKQWDNFSSSPVNYIEIPGEHHTIFDGEFVNKFHDIFVSELNRTTNENGKSK